jgi:hypothetical protein
MFKNFIKLLPIILTAAFVQVGNASSIEDSQISLFNTKQASYRIENISGYDPNTSYDGPYIKGGKTISATYSDISIRLAYGTPCDRRFLMSKNQQGMSNIRTVPSILVHDDGKNTYYRKEDLKENVSFETSYAEQVFPLESFDNDYDRNYITLYVTVTVSDLDNLGEFSRRCLLSATKVNIKDLQLEKNIAALGLNISNDEEHINALEQRLLRLQDYELPSEIHQKYIEIMERLILITITEVKMTELGPVIDYIVQRVDIDDPTIRTLPIKSNPRYEYYGMQ